LYVRVLKGGRTLSPHSLPWRIHPSSNDEPIDRPTNNIPPHKQQQQWQASSLIPDNVRKSLSPDQVKTLEAEAEKAKKAMEADLDPWFGEAEAEGNSFATFAQLE
jgi:hypothetical protein